MKVIVELSSPEELLRFFETMEPKQEQIKAMAPAPAPAPAAPKQQYQKPEVLNAAPQSAPDPVPAPTPAASKQQVSFEEVTRAAIRMMDAGKQNELRALLQKYGVQALPDLKSQPEKLAAFYHDLEVA